MPHLTFPLSGTNPILQVLIGLDGNTTASLQGTGQPIPPPVWASGLLDTGNDVTALAPAIFKQLGVQHYRTATTQTASGSVSVKVFKGSFNIPGKTSSGPMLVRPTLAVTELATALPNIDVLVGLDVLSECLLIVDWPGAYFTLAF